jgi:hypothetical protein
VVADYPVGLRTRRPGFKSQRLRFSTLLFLPSLFSSRGDWEASTVIERFGETVAFAPADDHARVSFTSGTVWGRERQVFFKGL